MDIVKFAKGFLPRIAKDDVMEDIRVTIQTLEDEVIPAYAQAAVFFNTHKLKAADNIGLAIDFEHKVVFSGPKQNNIIAMINGMLPSMLENLKYLDKQLSTILERDVVSDAMTAKKAVLLRSVESIDFASDFALDLLNVYYHNEAMAVEKSSAIEMDRVTRERVKKNIGHFALVLSDYARPTDKLKAIYGKVPEVMVNSGDEGAVSAFNLDRLDDFKSSAIAHFNRSPIYVIRLMIAEWQNNRYHAAVEKKKVLELRLMHLSAQRDGQNNPALEKQIDVQQRRVEKLARYIQDVEDELQLAEA